MSHTKQQIQALLGSAGIRPRHKWGQNFLIDLNQMRLLVDAAELKGNELILEVGCGTGSMTGLLAEKGGQIVAAEIDPYLQEIAGEQLSGYGNVRIVGGDILAGKNAISPAVWSALRENIPLVTGRFLLIANLPYQAASPLIVNLLINGSEHLGMPSGIYVTVQLEVAERMAARPGSKNYGMLSIILQATGEVEIIRKLKPQSFWPMPDVHSAFVVWRRDEHKCRQISNLKNLKTVIDALLRHRRKKISSCLNHSETKPDIMQSLHKTGIDINARGETLTPEQFVAIANRLGEYKF